MTKRDIVFSKKHIEQIPANKLEPGKKGFEIDTKSFISFKPNNKPELNWGISKINVIFDASLSDISNEIQNKKFFTLTVESDDNIFYWTKNNHPPHRPQPQQNFLVFEGSDDENGKIEVHYPHPTQLVKHQIHGDNVFDEQLWRTKSIKSVEGVWKRNSNDSTITGLINGKNIETVLGAGWEKTFDDKHTEEEIEKQSGNLFRKIIAEAKSQKITVNFTSQKCEKISSPPKNTKGLKVKLEEGIRLHVLNDFGHTREERIFQHIDFLFEKGKADAEEQYNMLTDSENKFFELQFEDSVFFRGGGQMLELFV